MVNWTFIYHNYDETAARRGQGHRLHDVSRDGRGRGRPPAVRRHRHRRQRVLRRTRTRPWRPRSASSARTTRASTPSSPATCRPAPAGYDYPALTEALPARTCSQLFQDSVDAAAPRTVTPYWSDISSALQSTWHPPSVGQPEHARGLGRLHRDSPRRKDTAVTTTTHCRAGARDEAGRAARQRPHAGPRTGSVRSWSRRP